MYWGTGIFAASERLERFFTLRFPTSPKTPQSTNTPFKKPLGVAGGLVYLLSQNGWNDSSNSDSRPHLRLLNPQTHHSRSRRVCWETGYIGSVRTVGQIFKLRSPTSPMTPQSANKPFLGFDSLCITSQTCTVAGFIIFSCA